MEGLPAAAEVVSGGSRGVRFRVVDHGADLGLVVYGGSEGEVYGNAVAGLFSVVMSARRVALREERQVAVEGSRYPLVALLNEILFLWETERFVVGGSMVEVAGQSVKALLKGEPFRQGPHRIKREVKAVTYHGYEMKEWQGRLRARLILDV